MQIGTFSEVVRRQLAWQNVDRLGHLGIFRGDWNRGGISSSPNGSAPIDGLNSKEGTFLLLRKHLLVYQGLPCENCSKMLTVSDHVHGVIRDTYGARKVHL